ncbi:hypothetical protein Q1695_001710 [Nippostrongylus brasiliensis]|nr:hypothetical protein Q1695_001710 [Nippostrongylus brasiliensis]
MPPAEEAPPTLESEVAYAIRRMKPGTASGPDGISADLRRAGATALCSLLFNHYLRLDCRAAHRKEPRIPQPTCPCLHAFDSVEINAVLNTLVHACVPSPFVEECFSNTSTTIQLFHRKLTIPIEKGVRQGDTISPKLFTTALQDAMKNLDWNSQGYPVDGKRISNLRFANSIVLISISTAEAEEMLSGRYEDWIGHEYVQNAIYGQPVV